MFKFKSIYNNILKICCVLFRFSLLYCLSYHNPCLIWGWVFLLYWDSFLLVRANLKGTIWMRRLNSSFNFFHSNVCGETNYIHISERYGLSHTWSPSLQIQTQIYNADQIPSFVHAREVSAMPRSWRADFAADSSRSKLVY